MIADREITVDGVPYVVHVTRHGSSWTTMLEAYEVTVQVEVRNGARFAVRPSPHHDHIRVMTRDGVQWGGVSTRHQDGDGDFDMEHWRAMCALSLRVIEAAFPGEYARGEKPLTTDGHHDGTVCIQEMPDVVRRVMRSYDARTPATMAEAAAMLARWEDGDDDAPHQQARRCLTHALRVGNVAAQEKWATWIVDPEAAVKAECAAMETQ